MVEVHDLVMFDLDGVLYVGEHAVRGAPDHLARVRSAGVHVAFVTNNASRPPAAVAEKLSGLGMPASSTDVVTSAQAAARVLLDRYGEGAPVSVLGALGLREALTEVGLVPVAVDDDRAVAIVSGFGPDVRWREVMRAATLVRSGLPWVASNTDLTLPTPEGISPGHGALVELVSRFSGVDPVVAGKPHPPLLRETVRRVGGERPLMVGDRLDTDIEAGHHSGVDSLLVLTGVTGLEELAAARPTLRPTYVATDLGGLFDAHPLPERHPDGWTLGGWTARVDGGRLEVTGDGDRDDWWRVVASASWQFRDDTTRPVDTHGLVPPGTDPAG
ncbi:HAD-IIA family hydrolase [Nocardioides euryhalodurans]|nr:HAD-IIA family hydrolase [Nocardioides euryhalodurans]